MNDRRRDDERNTLIVRLLVGLYVWAFLLSMEVFDFIDIDIEPGDALPEWTAEHILAHGQNVLAMLVLLGGVASAVRYFMAQVRHPATAIAIDDNEQDEPA